MKRHARAPSSDTVFTTPDLRRIFPDSTGSNVRIDIERHGRHREAQLSLPIGSYGERSPFVALRKVVNDWNLRAYIGFWSVTKADNGGMFTVEPRSFLLDELRRSPRSMTRANGSTYTRPLSRDEENLRESTELFQSIVITRGTGSDGRSWKFEKPERMIERQSYKDESTGRAVNTYRHSAFLFAQSRTDFVQIPRAVMYLEAEEAALAAGIAALVRDKALKWLERGYIEMSIRELATAIGEPVDERVRSRGLVWWSRFSEQFRNVVKNGMFGQSTLGKGDHGEQLTRLVPSEDLQTVYEPLRTRRDAAVERDKLAHDEADVRALLPSAKRGRGRPRKPLP